MGSLHGYEFSSSIRDRNYIVICVHVKYIVNLKLNFSIISVDCSDCMQSRIRSLKSLEAGWQDSRQI